jgi:hypothetical protein
VTHRTKKHPKTASRMRRYRRRKRLGQKIVSIILDPYEIEQLRELGYLRRTQLSDAIEAFLADKLFPEG